MLCRHPGAHLQSGDSDVTFLWLQLVRDLLGSLLTQLEIEPNCTIGSKTKPFSHTLHDVLHLLAYQDTSKDTKVLFSILNKLFSKK